MLRCLCGAELRVLILASAFLLQGVTNRVCTGRLWGTWASQHHAGLREGISPRGELSTVIPQKWSGSRHISFPPLVLTWNLAVVTQIFLPALMSRRGSEWTEFPAAWHRMTPPPTASLPTQLRAASEALAWLCQLRRCFKPMGLHQSHLEAFGSAHPKPPSQVRSR